MKAISFLLILISVSISCKPNNQKTTRVNSLFDAVEQINFAKFQVLLRQGKSVLIENPQGNLLHALSRSTLNTELKFHPIHERSKTYLDAGMSAPGYETCSFAGNVPEKLLVRLKPIISLPSISSVKGFDNHLTLLPRNPSDINDLNPSKNYALKFQKEWYFCRIEDKEIFIQTGENTDTLLPKINAYVSILKSDTKVKTQFFDAQNMMRYLIDNKVPKNKKNPQGRDVLQEAIYFENTDFAEILKSEL